MEARTTAAGGAICSVGAEEEAGDTAITLLEHLAGLDKPGVVSGPDLLHIGAGQPIRMRWIVSSNMRQVSKRN